MSVFRSSVDIFVAITRATIFSLCMAMIVGTARAESRPEPCPVETSVPWDACFGTYAYGNGTKYVGEFRNDQRHGTGTFTYPDGAKYEGEFANNEKNGHGTFTWPNGAKYVGAFARGTANGRGIEYAPDGAAIRTGLWADGEFVGGRGHASGE